MKPFVYGTKPDWFGDKAITVLGDSLSFGVGCSDPIPEHSAISFVKKAVQKACGGRMNYGFASSYATSWQPDNRADEIHMWPDRSMTDGEYDWLCDNDENGNRLISVAQTAKKHKAALAFSLREPYHTRYAYFCVYYHTAPQNGTFAVADSAGEYKTAANGQVIHSCDNAAEETKRTALYALSEFADGKFRIVVDSCNDAPVSITGIGYYRDADPDTLTFNAFCRGGIKLSNMSDTVLRQAAASDTLILGLGYNDAHFGYDPAVFTDRIEFLIRQVNKNGTRLFVNDYCWQDNAALTDEIAHAKSELARLARETNGIYVEQEALQGEAIRGDLQSDASDGVHPSDIGHRLIAKALVEAMGLDWTEEWT